MRCLLVNLKFKDRFSIDASADIHIPIHVMFYSSPPLPDWPKQRQILRIRALIPAHLIATELAGIAKARFAQEGIFALNFFAG